MVYHSGQISNRFYIWTIFKQTTPDKLMVCHSEQISYRFYTSMYGQSAIVDKSATGYMLFQKKKSNRFYVMTNSGEISNEPVTTITYDKSIMTVSLATQDINIPLLFFLTTRHKHHCPPDCSVGLSFSSLLRHFPLIILWGQSKDYRVPSQALN